MTAQPTLTGIVCDATDAPQGYSATPKADLPHDQGSLCRFCDWRAACNDRKTDFSKRWHRCMAHRRADGIGVVFKKLEG